MAVSQLTIVASLQRLPHMSASKAKQDAQQIQTLKFLVDTAVISNRGFLRGSFEPYNKVKLAPWLESLRYAEQRLEGIEAEVIILAAHLRELANLWEDEDDDKDVNAVTTARLSTKTKSRTDGYEISQPQIDVVRNAFSEMIGAVVDKKAERERCEKVLGEWLQEARERKLVMFKDA